MTDSPLVVLIGISISDKMTCLAQLCTDILELRSSSECRRNPNVCFDFPRFVRNWSTLMCPWWIGRGRAYLRLEAPPGYRTTASVWRVPGGPHFPPGSCAASGSTEVIRVTGRLHRREAAAGTPTRCCGGIARAPDLRAGPDPCARRGGEGEPGPAGARSPSVARHAYHRVPASDRVIGKALRAGAGHWP